MNGLKMRIGGFGGKVLAKLGVVPQQIAGGDIYPALEKGTIDAAEWVGPYDDEKLGFYKVAPYYYYPGFWEGGPTLHVFSTRRSGPSCPRPTRRSRSTRRTRATPIMQARYDALNPGAVRKLAAAGAQLRPYSHRDPGRGLQGVRRRSMPRPRPRTPTSRRSTIRLTAFRDDGFLWWQVAEYSFDSFSIRSRGKA